MSSADTLFPDEDEESLAELVRGASPLESYCSHKRYLSVSDLANQYWCEQRLAYTFTSSVPIREESAEMKEGSAIHLARELEVHDIVPVVCASIEDQWALKLLNLLYSLMSLSEGKLAREVPVFGEPFSMGIAVCGIIDEVRIGEDGLMEIVEVKTRAPSARCLVPTNESVRRRNSFQACLYKLLLDDLLCASMNGFPLRRMLQRLSLDVLKDLSLEVTSFSLQLGLNCTKFGEVVSSVGSFLNVVRLPASRVLIEYVSQLDASSGTVAVEFDFQVLKQTVSRMLEFWHGDRGPHGVDIEEAWKCQSCEYADECQWRQRKALVPMER